MDSDINRLITIHVELLNEGIRVEANDINVQGAPKYAFYNPPWTLPLMRRNEVMFEIIE